MTLTRYLAVANARRAYLLAPLPSSLDCAPRQGEDSLTLGASIDVLIKKGFLMSNRIRLGLFVALLSAPALAGNEIYQCIEKGVTKFSQTPCGEIPSQSTLYQPKAPAMLFSHAASPPTPLYSQPTPLPNTGFVPLSSVRIDDDVCEILSVNGRYMGKLENSSKTQSYEVRLEVRFDYEKSGMVYPNWDHRSQLFHLKPRQSQSFSVETRTLPPDSEITCKPEITGRSLAGG